MLIQSWIYSVLDKGVKFPTLDLFIGIELFVLRVLVLILFLLETPLIRELNLGLISSCYIIN